MQKLIRPVLTALSLALALGPDGAGAQEKDYLGMSRDWGAFQATVDGQKVCYIGSKPTAHEEGGRPRGGIFVLVTHRPAENSRDVVSVIAGYDYMPESEVEMTIGDRTFTLFTRDDRAWAVDSDADREIVAAMRAGTEMVVKGVSNRGTETTDTYSLYGFTAAYNTINEACPPP